jgi:hypothetical protein
MYTNQWKCFRSTGWVASREHIILPFITPQPHALLSADSKVTQAANNKERLGMPHDVVWCRTIFVVDTQLDAPHMLGHSSVIQNCGITFSFP